MERAAASWRFLLPLLLLLLALPAAAQSPDDDSDDRWLHRTLNRFFGRATLPGDGLDGVGRELVNPYLEYAGRPIEVVIVQQVKKFEPGWDDDRRAAERLLNALSKPLQDYTREGVIRRHLLFERGDEVIPFDLADSERLLRGLPYINDVRIHVVPIQGSAGGVAVIVETNDRWPFGVDATLIDGDDWRARLYSSNLLGLGVELSHQVLRKGDSEPSWGYEGRLGQHNIAGSFWNGMAVFEDSHRQGRLYLSLDRPLAHPGLNLIGGVSWEDHDERGDREGVNGYHRTDVWAGEVLRLYDHRSAMEGPRAILVPALRYRRQEFYNRPVVTPDSNRSYHDTEQYMASLAWQRFEPFKTSYLYADGEVEDILSGVQVKLTGLMEDREFERRLGAFLDTKGQAALPRGDVTFLGLSLGGFFDGGEFEDGILGVEGGYVSPLLGQGRIRHRLYSSLKWTRGIGRAPYDRIYLDDRSGISHLESQSVAGNKRLVFKNLYRFFPSLSVLGFETSFFGYADVGLIGADGVALADSDLRTSLGVGVRVRNPRLVLPTFQVHVFRVTRAEGGGFRVGIDFGNAPGGASLRTGVRPGTLAYE